MPASEPALPSRAPAYLIAGLIHATAMLLAFPPVGLWGFAFIAPLPIVWAGWARARDLIQVGRRARLGRAPLMVMLGVLPFHLYCQQWVMEVSAAGYIPMVLIMASMSGLMVWILSVCAARWTRTPLALLSPLAWTAVEVFRGEALLTGYPWIFVAHPLIDAPWIPAAATLMGTYFVGFLVVAVAGGAMDALTSQGSPLRLAIPAGVAAACVGIAVAARPPAGGAKPITLGIVQTNIPQSNKLEWSSENKIKDFRRFCELTRLAAARKPDLIIWPETMFPGMTLSESAVAEERAAALTFAVDKSVDPRVNIPTTDFYDGLTQLSREIGTPMLVGALGLDGLSIKPGATERGVDISYTSRYNSVFLVTGGRVDPVPYHKLELTPFGEEMPAIRHWPWLQTRLMAIGAGGMSFDLAAGQAPRPFDLGAELPVRVVTPICFEATKPGLCRRLVRDAGNHPVLTANLTNDGWFGRFRPGRLQHFQVARWRCVELGVPMVRAANTGISAAIDARGRIVASGVDGHPGAWNTDGVLTASLSPEVARTLYARVGDTFGWMVLVAAGVMLVVSLVGSRTPKSGSEGFR